MIRQMLLSSLIVIDDTTPRPAALNMALDEALFWQAEVPTLRAYRWETAAVSFGYFGRYEETREQYPGRELVRRWTGGGIVDHAEDFTYSLVLPGKSERSSREIYCAVHEAIAAAWEEGATVAGTDATRVSASCFENPVAGDVLADGRKVAGAAQRRTRQGLLLQGSVCPRREGLLERFTGNLAKEIARGAVLPEAAALAGQIATERYATEAWLRRIN